MSLLTDFGENYVLDRILGSGVPATVYVALLTGLSPEDADTSAEIAAYEPSGSHYARVAVPNDAVNWPPASGGVKTNGQEIVFNTVTGSSWGSMKYWALLDGNVGNVILRGALTVPRLAMVGRALRFMPGALIVSAD